MMRESGVTLDLVDDCPTVYCFLPEQIYPAKVDKSDISIHLKATNTRIIKFEFYFTVGLKQVYAENKQLKYIS